MPRLSIAILAAAALAACQKSEQTEAKPVTKADCASAIKQMSDAQAIETAAMIAKLSPGEKALVGPQMEAAIADQGRRTTVTIAACQNDKWSDEVVGCLADAKEAPVRGACMKKLQPEQLERLKKALYGPM